jgi:hypothetical protein
MKISDRFPYRILTKSMEEQLCLLGYNAEQSVEIQTTFPRNNSPPSSGSKNNMRLPLHEGSNRVFPTL